MLPGIVRRLGLVVLAPVGALAAVFAARRMTRNRYEVDQPNAADPAAPASPAAAPAPSNEFAELWQQAERGDARAVRRLLRQHTVPPDTPHPDTGAPLVLDLAGINTVSEQMDSDLADVLRVLGAAGWTLTVQAQTSGDNALHVLARQEWGYHIYHRLKALITMEAENPEEDSMLVTVNAVGLTPEGVAAADRGDISVYLYAQRLRAQIAAERGHGGHGEPGGLLRVLRVLRVMCELRVL